jgi:hypothetical protein
MQNTADATDLLGLSREGKTAYSIIIGKEADKAEIYAAEELQHFLHGITGAEFPIRSDAVKPSVFEIVLGRSNRVRLEDIPSGLRPETLEGFVVFRDGPTVYILGNCPRATVYGIYDFLEMDLGVRFLAPGVYYIPENETLCLDFESRRYDPPLVYRNIHLSDRDWQVRNRINASWARGVPKEKLLGGQKFLCGGSHSLPRLFPYEKYFDFHPEYYALIDGKRRQRTTSGGRWAGPCLTHPDVLDLVTQKIAGEIEAYKKTSSYNPDTVIVVPVEYDDATEICQCEKCRRVNEEEGTEGGTLFRFLNAIAERIEEDYPNVLIESLAYHQTSVPPKKTRLRENIIIRYAPINSDFARAVDDDSSRLNQKVYKNLQQWSKVCPAGFYVWNYYTNFSSFFTPYPNLKFLGYNFRLFHEYGMKGMYAQGSKTPGSGLCELRYYLLAQLMWRPQTDVRKTMEEFCRLFYGKGAEAILEYIDYMHAYHEEYVDKDGTVPLTCYGAPKYGHAYGNDFIHKADAILARAEAEAETEQTKFRAAKERLPIWYLILTREFARKGQVLALPKEWKFKVDQDDSGVSEKWFAQTQFDSWDAIRTDDFWTKQGYDYHGVAWYAVEFELPAEAAGESLSLYFGAVDGTCDIYLDGEKVGQQKKPPKQMWDTAFYVPLDLFVQAGEHTLVVRVEKESHNAGIWKPVSLVDSSAPVPESVRYAGQRFIQISKQAGVRKMKEDYTKDGGMPEFYGKIHTLLDRKPYRPDGEPVEGLVHQDASLLENYHKTWRVVEDPTSANGYCATQNAGKAWTSLQAIRWDITRPLKEGGPYFLRARIKVDKKNNDGLAFRLGYATVKKNFSAEICDEIQIAAVDVPDQEWKWYRLSGPLKSVEGQDIHGQYAFVWTSESPGVEKIYVDSFELVPVDIAQ